jgi:hypothetical protein
MLQWLLFHAFLHTESVPIPINIQKQQRQNFADLNQRIHNINIYVNCELHEKSEIT